MKKVLKIGITLIYIIQTLIMILMYQTDITFISVTLDGYMLFLAALITAAYLRVAWHSSEKTQNIILIILPIAYFFSHSIFVIGIIGVMSIKAMNRYERNVFNYSLRAVYLLLLIFALVNYAMLPAVFLGYQDMQLSVYKVVESPEGDNLIEIRNFKNITYQGANNIELHFNLKRHELFKYEIGIESLTKRPEVNIEWLDNDNVVVNTVHFRFNGETVERVD